MFQLKKMKILKPKQIIVALDFDSFDSKLNCKNLDPAIFRLKIGKQLYAGEGPKIVDIFNKQGLIFF